LCFVGHRWDDQRRSITPVDSKGCLACPFPHLPSPSSLSHRRHRLAPLLAPVSSLAAPLPLPAPRCALAASSAPAFAAEVQGRSNSRYSTCPMQGLRSWLWAMLPPFPQKVLQGAIADSSLAVLRHHAGGMSPRAWGGGSLQDEVSDGVQRGKACMDLAWEVFLRGGCTS